MESKPQISKMFSAKGKELILVNGFKFSFGKILKGEVERWRCANKACKAYVKVCDDNVVEGSLEHNHEKDSEQYLNRQIVKNTVKLKATDDFLAPARKLTQELEPEITDSLSKRDIMNIRRSIYVARKSHQKRLESGETLKIVKNPNGNRLHYVAPKKVQKVKIENPLILDREDILHHIGLSNKAQDLPDMFGDVKFVCFGASPLEMSKYSEYLMKEINYKIPTGTMLQDISSPHSFQYSMYKVGPILCVSYGIGSSSLGILLHELIKLLYHAQATDPVFIKMSYGASIGLEGGTVIFTEEAVDAKLNNNYEMSILGNTVNRLTSLDQKLMKELRHCITEDDAYPIAFGKTMAVDDYYEGQCRLDGAFCTYSEENRIEYLTGLRNSGVVNMDMESTIFAALTHQANIRAAILSVSLVDRLKSDRVYSWTEDNANIEEWKKRPREIIARYIKSCVRKKRRNNNCRKKIQSKLPELSDKSSPPRGQFEYINHDDSDYKFE